MEQNEKNYFGNCPGCGENEGYLNIRDEHWYKCDSCRTKWCIGSNLFSSWRDGNQKNWDENKDRNIE